MPPGQAPPVREGGKNGTVEINGPTLTRTFKKMIGKDDVLTVPIRMVASVHVDRRMRTDVVTVTTTGGERLEWKTPGAQAIADAINHWTP